MQALAIVRSLRAWCVGAAIAGGGLAASGVSPASAEEGTGNMVFFKGGFMNLNQDRAGQTFADTGGVSGVNGGNAGWYAGAGLDLVMSKNAQGAMDKTGVDARYHLMARMTNTNSDYFQVGPSSRFRSDETGG